MQPESQTSHTRHARSFSTLYGSKWVATITVSSRIRSSWGFSTLYGSKWVATKSAHEVAGVFDEFQYPLRVEVGCNEWTLAGSGLSTKVSVPSTGRSGLQQRANWEALAFVISFSTLYGSKWVATRCYSGACVRSTLVSVPSTGRSGLQRHRQHGI